MVDQDRLKAKRKQSQVIYLSSGGSREDHRTARWFENGVSTRQYFIGNSIFKNDAGHEVTL